MVRTQLEFLHRCIFQKTCEILDIILDNAENRLILLDIQVTGDNTAGLGDQLFALRIYHIHQQLISNIRLMSVKFI